MNLFELLYANGYLIPDRAGADLLSLTADPFSVLNLSALNATAAAAALGATASVANLVSSQGFDVTISGEALAPLLATQSFDVSVTGSSGATPIDFVTLMGADTLSYHQSNLGVTIGASFDWQDQSSGNKDYTRATAATGPSQITSDATLNNLDTLRFTSASSQYCDSPLTHPLPTTTPTFVFIVFKQRAWGNNKSILTKATTARFKLGQDTVATPGLASNNGTQSASSTDMPLNTWGRVYQAFTGTASDFMKVMGGSAVVGALGNNSSANNRRLGANQNLTAFADIDVFCVGEGKRILTVGEMASLDAWVTQTCGSGLV